MLPIMGLLGRSPRTCPPKDKPPDYTRMTDKEFSSTVEKEHGFTPL